jgi:hypothetical protein
MLQDIQSLPIPGSNCASEYSALLPDTPDLPPMGSIEENQPLTVLTALDNRTPISTWQSVFDELPPHNSVQENNPQYEPLCDGSKDMGTSSLDSTSS